MHNIYNMELYFTGVGIAICTFLTIGLFHPLVIKVEYESGEKGPRVVPAALQGGA